MTWVIGLVAQLSNLCICLGFIRYYGSISRIWQAVSANFLLIKSYSVAQISAKVVASILFPSIHYIIKKLPQKRFYGMKDEEIIKLFFLSLEKATFFPDQCF